MRKLSPLMFLLISFLLIALAIITFSSLVDLYANKSRILEFLDYEVLSGSSYDIDEEDTYWAKEILNGGYILHFRHAERDKGIDVGMYDSLESDLHDNGANESRYAENEYFEKSVCLNERGKMQARAMGEHIKNIGLPVGPTLSSVSCRGRQTAELAFGGYDSLHRILVHSGPYNEGNSERVEKIKNFYSEMTIEDGKNTIVSAHNGVIRCEMFSNDCGEIALEEGGFYVISKRDGGLFLEHKFNNFLFFNRTFYER